MYQATTRMNPTTLTPLRRGAICYRHRGAGSSYRPVVIASILVGIVAGLFFVV